MAKLTDQIFEVEYKKFLDVRAAWEKLMQSRQIFIDTDTQGRQFRPIALSDNMKELAMAEHLLAEWERFFELCEARNHGKKTTILKEIYAPIPFILNMEEKMQITRRNAHSSVDIPLESVLSRYDSLINRFDTSGIANDFITHLKNEREFFKNEPAGTSYRLRLSGFKEVSICGNNPLVEEAYRTQVGSHGVFVYSRTLRKEHVFINDLKDGQSKRSLFDRIVPLKCSLFENGKLYDLKSIKRERYYSDAFRVINRNEISVLAGGEIRHKRKQDQLRGTARYDKFVASSTEKEKNRRWMLSHDYTLLERMRAMGDMGFTGITYLRARYLTDEELSKGFYQKPVFTAREKMIADGIQLYQDTLNEEKK